LNARFSGGPDDPFVIPTGATARGALALGLGLVAHTRSRFTLSVDYHGLLANSDTTQHSVVGRLRAAF